MAKCPKCGGELAQQSDGAFICASCGSRFVPRRRQEEQQAQPTRPRQTQQAQPGCEQIRFRQGQPIQPWQQAPQRQTPPIQPWQQAPQRQTPPMQRGQQAPYYGERGEYSQYSATDSYGNGARNGGYDDVPTLDSRLEIGGYDNRMYGYQNFNAQGRADKPKNNKAIAVLKKSWWAMLLGLLALIAFITLMVTLVGLRGIYVNVNDSNDFIDFTATSYHTSYVDMFTGETSLEEGKWKLKGNVLTLTAEDELFGSMDMDMKFEKLDGFKRIRLDGVEYKRVSLVGIKTTQKQVKITFDPQNGGKPTVFKMKIGSVFNDELPAYLDDDPLFEGWFTEIDGKGEQFDLYNLRVWEDITYYAHRSFFVIENGVLKKANSNKMVGDIVLPDGITSIGADVFRDCGSMTSVTIPDSVTSIGDSAFRDCVALTELVLPDSIGDVGSYAFSGCTGLQTLTIGESAQRLGKGAFENCTNLQTVYWNAELNYNLGIYFDANDRTWKHTLFEGCSNLQTLYIGSQVKGLISFGFVFKFKNVYVESLKSYCELDPNVEFSDDVLYYLVDMLSSFYLNSDVNLYAKQDDGEYELVSGDVVIPEGTSTIGLFTFAGIKDITSVTIPDSVHSIGISAFFGCTGLREITIPGSVKDVQPFAFGSCTGLQTVTIGAGVTSIGDDAFSGCYKLVHIRNLSDVEISSPAAINGEVVTNLDAEFQNTIEKDANGILTYTVGDTVYAFGYEGTDSHLDLSKNSKINAIYPYAFIFCSNITSVAIPDSITSIGDSAFYGCTGLTSITIPGNVTSIGSWAFEYCTGLQTATINAQSIGYGAFEDCTSLQTVTIGVGVQSIGYKAFYNCKNLKDIYYAGDQTQWEDIEKGSYWDTYYDGNGGYHAIAYQVHYNSSSPRKTART